MKQLDSAISIPLYIDMNNQYDFISNVNHTASVKITDPNSNLIFENKKYTTDYRVTYKPKLSFRLKGTYTVDATFYTDSITKKAFKQTFVVNGDEIKIRLQITMEQFSYEYNGIRITRYLDNKYHVKLIRNWEPQKMFENGKVINPSYGWTNTYDSTIYGVQRRSINSSDATMMKDNISGANMHFEKFTDSGWQPIKCYRYYLKAPLTKGQMGVTLIDTLPPCTCKLFERNKYYRMVVEYGINDDLYVETKAIGNFEDCLYAEEYIYQVTDEFIVK